LKFSDHYGAARFTHIETVEGGRLGNVIIQNLALSLLSKKYNIPVNYLLLDECSRLGLRLSSGVQLMSGPPHFVCDSNLRELLEANSTTLRNRSLTLNRDSPPYFQTPWFARLLKSSILPLMGADILRANPWRSRVGINDDTFVHIRLGDKARDISRSSSDYITAVASVSQFRGKKSGSAVFIASDSPTHVIVKTVAAFFEATVLDDLNRVETIQFGCTARNLVLSDGTFSWVIGVFATILANATNNPAPVIKWLPRIDVWHGDIFVFNEWERV
jgi:hypothetical protein